MAAGLMSRWGLRWGRLWGGRWGSISTDGTTVADAYLDDFVKVDAVGWFVVVEEVDRVVSVPAVGRMVVVR